MGLVIMVSFLTVSCGQREICTFQNSEKLGFDTIFKPNGKIYEIRTIHKVSYRDGHGNPHVKEIYMDINTKKINLISGQKFYFGYDKRIYKLD